MLIPHQTGREFSVYRSLSIGGWGLALGLMAMVSPIVSSAALALAPAVSPSKVPSKVPSALTPPDGESIIQPLDTHLKQSTPTESGNESGTAPSLSAPVIPPLPESIPAAIAPERSGIVGLTPAADDDLGIGHLRPRDLGFLGTNDWEDHPLAYAGWLRSVAIPLYVSPGSEPWGWLVNGWLMIPGYDPIAIGRDATFSMVQAEPGLYSFPVLELREDGWFQFQYTPAGAAWAHIDHLEVGAMALEIEPWEEQAETAAQVKFLRHGLSQPLLAEPMNNRGLRSLVSINSLIQPLEVNGDWMRVSVTQPALGCRPLPGSTTEEGWIRWRDEQQSLLVWFGAEESCELSPSTR